jgi:hypothetical protein
MMRDPVSEASKHSINEMTPCARIKHNDEQ